MFNHIMIGSNHIDRSQDFYDAVLAVLGVSKALRTVDAAGRVRLFYRHDGNTLAVSQPINNEPASSGNGGTIAFKCSSLDQVREFHDTAVSHGGTSIEDAPGPRTTDMGVINLAYVRDIDGNKLCAFHRI